MQNKKKRSFFNLTSAQENTDTMNTLQNTLIYKEPTPQSMDFEDYEKIYLQSKAINQIISQQRKKKKQAEQNIVQAKKKIANIKQLQYSVDKQVSYMKMQTDKISDVYRLNKILMMEKVVRMQREAEELENKKSQCQKIRGQKQKSAALANFRKIQRSEYAKLKSLNETQMMKKSLEQVRAQTMEMKRRRVEEIKSEQERRRSKSRKIQQFKVDRARSNYFNKLIDLKNQIFEKQNNLNVIYQEEVQEERKAVATAKITNEYISSFFATETTTL